MNCPYYNFELFEHDKFGKPDRSMSGLSKDGIIYKCENDYCNGIFHVHNDKPDHLHEGMPC
jgi:hypothetical protein